VYGKWAQNWRLDQIRADQAYRRRARLPAFMRDADAKEARDAEEKQRQDAAAAAAERARERLRQEEEEASRLRAAEVAKKRAKAARKEVCPRRAVPTPGHLRVGGDRTGDNCGGAGGWCLDAAPVAPVTVVVFAAAACNCHSPAHPHAHMHQAMRKERAKFLEHKPGNPHAVWELQSGVPSDPRCG
jgi:hypothetical protein